MSKIYFDNAATTKIDSIVIDQMQTVMRENYGNPNSTHSQGRSSRTLIEKLEKQLLVNLMSLLLRYFLLHAELSLTIWF